MIEKVINGWRLTQSQIHLSSTLVSVNTFTKSSFLIVTMWFCHVMNHVQEGKAFFRRVLYNKKDNDFMTGWKSLNSIQIFNKLLIYVIHIKVSCWKIWQAGGYDPRYIEFWTMGRNECLLHSFLSPAGIKNYAVSHVDKIRPWRPSHMTTSLIMS